MDVQAFLRGLAFEARTAQRVPTIVVIFVNFDNFVNSCYVLSVSEVQHELAGIAGAEVEVRTAGTERHVGAGPVQIVPSTEEQLCLVIGREADGTEGALEATAQEGLLVVGGGAADGDAGELGLLDSCALVVPLDDERCTGWDNPPFAPPRGIPP